MTKHTTLVAAVAFLIGAAVSAGVFYRAKPPGPAWVERRDAAGVKELAEKLSEMELKAAERELCEALSRDPKDRDAVRRFISRVRDAAAQGKEGKRPFGSL